MHIVTNFNLVWIGVTTVALSSSGHSTNSIPLEDTKPAGNRRTALMLCRIIIKSITRIAALAGETSMGIYRNQNLKKTVSTSPILATSFNRKRWRLKINPLRVLGDNNQKFC